MYGIIKLKRGERYMFWFYIGIFVVFLVTEALTANLITIWMAAASLITGIYAWFFPEQIVPQAFIFIVLSIILIIATKPLAKKITKEPEKTNADSLVKKEGIVISEIDNDKFTGLVKVNGQVWTARSAGGEKIAENQKICVVGIEGVKLMVVPIE